MRKEVTVLAFAIVLIAIAALYWPVIHADFVWDDWPSFHDEPWLTQGNLWKHYIFNGFNGWSFYFRPLVLAFFTLQLRIFDGMPGPMHVVSLTLHLLNTILVGLLAWHCAGTRTKESRYRSFTTITCMAVYGLHPALIEPVAWIGCQFELITTMLILLGLLANLGIQHKASRAASVSAFFFLAACSKESAISFPILIAIFDWAFRLDPTQRQPVKALRQLLSENWQSYAGLLGAGAAYLLFRHWGLGGFIAHAGQSPITPPNPLSGHPIARIQEVCAIYVHYWRLMVWPMPGIGPIHPLDRHIFQSISTSALMIDALAISIVASGLYFSITRQANAGYIALAVTASLLPVLHIFGADFDISLYHERYVMTALATACGMFPLIWPRNLPTQSPKRWLVLPCVIAATFWLIFAAIDIRLTLPMWTNDTNLWRWALSMYPHDSQSRQNLLDAYLRNKDETGFRKLSITIIEDRVPCRYCLLLIARHAAFDNDDPVTASMALDKLNRIGPDVSNSPALQLYLMATGRTYLLQGRYDEAVRTFAEAVKTYPFDAPAQLSLANALALDGQSGPAREMGMIGIAMLPARQRSAALALLNDNISNGLARSAGVESGEKQQERAR